MTIKVGSIVSHADVREWGVGRVLEVTSTMATIHFSDGKNRKISSSHYSSLRPASAESYVPPSEPATTAVDLRPSRKAKKKK